jgi:DNA-binding NarL/FixJ family response regulator
MAMPTSRAGALAALATSMAPLRVAVVDDHPLFREGVRRIVQAEPDLSFAGEAGTAEEAVAMIEDVRPDVLLLDLRLAGARGLDVLAGLAGRSNAPRVVIVTAFPEEHVIAEAVRLGARGVVLKDAAPEALLAAIRRVAAGDLSLPPDLATRLVGALARGAGSREQPPYGHLTPREREIVVLVGRGLKNRDIAQRLEVAEKTVKGHLTNIFHKIGVADRLELALWAIKTRMTPSPGDL